jgi:hypothetical protein
MTARDHIINRLLGHEQVIAFQFFLGLDPEMKAEIPQELQKLVDEKKVAKDVKSNAIWNVYSLTELGRESA